MTDRALWHPTPDTMHVARTPRSEVADHVAAHLAGVLARTRTTGRPARLREDDPHALRLLREGEGNAAFSILTRETGGEAHRRPLPPAPPPTAVQAKLLCERSQSHLSPSVVPGAAGRIRRERNRNVQRHLLTSPGNSVSVLENLVERRLDEKEGVLVAEASDQSRQGFGDAFGGYTVLSGYGWADASSVTLVKVPASARTSVPPMRGPRGLLRSQGCETSDRPVIPGDERCEAARRGS